MPLGTQPIGHLARYLWLAAIVEQIVASIGAAQFELFNDCKLTEEYIRLVETTQIRIS
ncbi:MAG: hypothetical protein ABSG03_23905 [Bryobacteraceae bacterium]|jgi:hypothetical protein